MRQALPRGVSLLPLLTAALALVAAGGAQAQTGAKAAAPPIAKTEPAMAGYERVVTPAQAAKNTGFGADPLEPMNRQFFALNQVLDRAIIRPAAVFWSHAAPKPLRQGINNFLSNLGEPIVVINDLLQGHPATAAGTATRFVANSTIGLLGVFDVTGKSGLPHHDNGFGLTLGRWGVKAGPYIYLPLLGPTTLRDGFGTLADTATNPLTYTRSTGDGGLTTGLGIIGGLDARADADGDLKALKAMSTDEYAALRSFFLQNRQAQVTGGKIDLNALPDFDDPEAAGPTTTPAAPGSIAPSAKALAEPRAAAPGVPQGDAAALPSPATPAEPNAAPATPPAAPKGV